MYLHLGENTVHPLFQSGPKTIYPMQQKIKE